MEFLSKITKDGSNETTAGVLGHKNIYAGNKNEAIQIGRNHNNYHKGDRNRTIQQGSAHHNIVDSGDSNGIAQFGDENHNFTNGDRNRTGQIGTGLENNINKRTNKRAEEKKYGETTIQPNDKAREDVESQQGGLQGWLGKFRMDWPGAEEWTWGRMWAWINETS
ncbi:uncharacterized protein F4812DRAFT_470811 [Daldinia caldariorum]|uniref:uncharacterized protein n=1 Tax=Daldinia caldariorum TaxID=326644 RepID=UPI00200824B2|nr:uncharacterized protein F4812DRAFT_470811 [Daldinia caldariorum]KAI1468185.1 hypothetical protein F4812DRAFT_470811 [Daldinia caldariorum]